MIIYSTGIVKALTFGFARGLTIFPFIFIVKKEKDNKTLINHEKIHIKQQLELLLVGFWIIYFINFAYNYIKYRRFNDAYYKIIFEKEAFENHDNLDYLRNRKIFAFRKYI